MRRFTRIILRVLLVTALVNGSLLVMSEEKITHRGLFEFSNMQGKMEDLGLFIRYWSTAVYTSVLQVSEDVQKDNAEKPLD